MTILPKNRTGKWSVSLFIVFILLRLLANIISYKQANYIEYPNPFNSPLLGTVIYIMFLTAIIASFIGIIAIKKNNERSILVYISIPLGIMYFIGVIMLIIGNIIGPPNKFY